LQVLEQAGVFACWFVVGRKEMFCNIGGQSMTFVHSDLYLSTHVSRVVPAGRSVSEDTNFSDRRQSRTSRDLPESWAAQKVKQTPYKPRAASPSVANQALAVHGAKAEGKQSLPGIAPKC
jgi:hypothetical protein